MMLLNRRNRKCQTKKLFKLCCVKLTTRMKSADNEEEDEELDPAPPPSLREAQQALTVVLRYFQSNNNTTADEIDKVMDIDKLLKERALKNLCQTKITGFFNRLTQ